MKTTTTSPIISPLPDRLTFDIGLPNSASMVCSRDEIRKTCLEALQSIKENLKPGATLCIVVDDYTRATPTQLILKILLPEIEKQGIGKNDIFFMFASGSHKLMDEKQKRARLGNDVFEQYRSMDHCFFDRNHLVRTGSFEDGTPILINRFVLEADLRLSIGTLAPHLPAGFSGGAKMLLPGIAGEDTVHHMHMLGALDPDQEPGRIDTKPRKLMEAFAEKAEPFAIINTVLDAQSRPVGIVGGHYIEAHRRGVEIAKKVYFVKISEPADLVISDARGHDADMTQAHKGLFSAKLAVKDKGEILLLTDCRDGVSPVHHKGMLEFGTCTNAEVVKALNSGRMKDPLAAIEILHANVVREKARTYICSAGITKDDARKMNLIYVDDPDRFVMERTRKELTVGRISSSTFVVPYL